MRLFVVQEVECLEVVHGLQVDCKVVHVAFRTVVVLVRGVHGCQMRLEEAWRHHVALVFINDNNEFMALKV